MQWLYLFLLCTMTHLQAEKIPFFQKPIIDLKDANTTSNHKPYYDRPNFIFSTQGKYSHVAVLTDKYIPHVDLFRKMGYEKIVAYTAEPRAIDPSALQYLEVHQEKFDLILTFDQFLLDRYPEKCRFIHAVGLSSLRNVGLHAKSKMCSIIVSEKNWTEGHRLRHVVLDRYKHYFDICKTYETPWEETKDRLTNDFYYSVIIENSRSSHYFTEKIRDCFRAGTVPIYWGCPTIGKFFDMDGIIMFNSVEELGTILQNLSVEDYNRRLPAIQRNFELVAQYPENDFILRPEFPDSLDVIWPYLEVYFKNNAN